MRNKGLIAIATIVAVVAVGGIGFATFTSTVNGSVNVSAGTLNLVWTGFYNHGFAPANATYLTCVNGPGVKDPGVMYFNATNMAGGDSCFFNATIQNTGSLPAQWVTICYILPSDDYNVLWVDTLGGYATPSIAGYAGTHCGVISGLSIAAGASALYAVQMTWDTTYGQNQGTSFSYAISLTGQVGV